MMKLYWSALKICLLTLFIQANTVCAKIIFEPYFSIKSTKGISTNRSQATETETVKNREEKGIKAGLSFYKFFKIQASIGQSFLSTTSTTSEIKDEYGEIDFNSEMSLDPTTNDQTLVRKEFDNRATFSFLLDPSFSIFILRTKAGVVARQRQVTVTQSGVNVFNEDPPISFKPLAGAGVGVKFSYKIYAILEYGFYFYKFPQPSPFERDLSISFGFSI